MPGYYATQEGGNYAVFDSGGSRVSTVAAQGLTGFGLSSTNLGAKAPTTPAPTAPVAPKTTTPSVTSTPTSTSTPPVQTTQPGQQPQPSANMIQSTAPGASATTLFDYYSAKGQNLPTVGDRAKLYESMGLGPAKEYTGSASENNELLEKMQLNDHSLTTIGSKTAQQNGGVGGTSSNPVNQTDAGTSLAKTLSGTDAASTIDNYRTYLAAALGSAADKVNADQSAVNSFFSTDYKSADDILSEEMSRQGVSGMNTSLAELDKLISDKETTLNNLPSDIKTTLQDVGVSQAQLDRLVNKESKPATDALNQLLKDRGALSTEIDKATTFAKQFADTRVSAQAARLAYLEWQFTSDNGDYKNLDADVKSAMTQAVSDKKEILTTALTAAKNGASSDVVDQILSSNSASEAIQNAGSTLVTPKKTTASTTAVGQMNSDIKSASTYLEVGAPDKGYNGRGPDGFVDPNLYVALYNAASHQYGPAGVAAFIKKYPPAKNLNPANIGAGNLPSPIQNALLAGQKVAGIK